MICFALVAFQYRQKEVFSSFISTWVGFFFFKEMELSRGCWVGLLVEAELYSVFLQILLKYDPLYLFSTLYILYIYI